MGYKTAQILSSKKIKRFLLLALVTLLIILPPLSNYTLSHASAAFTVASVAINNSQAGASNVTYSFKMTASINTAIQELRVIFCTTASGACSTPTGMVTTGAVLVSDNITGTGRTNTFTGNGTLITAIDTPASQNPLGVLYAVRGITNPTTTNTTFYARVTSYSDAGSTAIDTLTLATAVLTSTSLAVTATVDPNFTFRVNGVASGANVNGSTTTATAAANTIPFGTLTAGTPSIVAHDIEIITNAGSGYTVTASASATPPLTAGSNNIDPFTGTNASPSTWSEPNGTSANTNTGFFGYTTEDSSLCTGTATRFASNNWAGTSITGAEVMCGTAGTLYDSARVGWQVEVNSIQPAGGYTGTAILIATPTY